MLSKVSKRRTGNATLNAATRYASSGWVATPVRRPDEEIQAQGETRIATGKEPIGRFSKLQTPEQGLRAIARQTKPSNIGVLLGSRSNHLTDIDLDCPEALSLHRQYLPRSNAVFGRDSAPDSHHLYIAKGATTRKFVDPCAASDQAATLLEIRAEGKGGGVSQTVFPPSRHASGETIRWSRRGEPSVVSASTLETVAHRLAAACLVLRYYAAPGSRHELHLYLAGLFAKGGLALDPALQLLKSVCTEAGDPELADRLEAVRSTYARRDQGQEIAGYGRLVGEGLLDPKVCDKLCQWLGLRAEAHLGFLPTFGIVRFSRADVARNVQLIREVVTHTKEDVFEFGRLAVRLEHLPPGKTAHVEAGIERCAGTLVRPLEAAHLRVVVTDGVTWMTETRSSWTSVQPPIEDLKSFLSTDPLRRGLRPLTGIITTPTLRRDGTLVDQTGYDEATRLFLAPVDGCSVQLPNRITPTDLDHARVLYAKLLFEAPFEDSDVGVTCTLALVLSILLKHLVGPTPFFVFDSPVAGTGKTFTAKLAARIATGHGPPSITAGWDNDELDKRLGSAALRGDQVLLIDNVERELRGDQLCTMITDTTITVRILGKSENRDIPMAAVMVATGNNIMLHSDLVRRSLVVRLNAAQERPESRVFKRDPLKMVANDRGEYVMAALSVVKAYIDGGMPVQKLAPLQGFGGFNRYIRSALVWAGFADPAAAQEATRRLDVEAEEFYEFLLALKEEFNDDVLSAADVWEITVNALYATKSASIIRGYCRDYRSTKGVGRMLAKQRDRIVDGLRLVQAEDDKHKKVRRYRVEEI